MYMPWSVAVIDVMFVVSRRRTPGRVNGFVSSKTLVLGVVVVAIGSLLPSGRVIIPNMAYEAHSNLRPSLALTMIPLLDMGRRTKSVAP